jgi:hypothetical protein
VPLYFFHVHNSIGFVEDEEGRELPDLETARAEGLKGVRSILAEDVSKGHLDLGGRLEVIDEQGRLVLTIAFADALDLSRQPE